MSVNTKLGIPELEKSLVNQLPVISLDADIASADWTKQSWDLPPYKSREFLEQFADLEAFRRLPVYRHAVNNGLILDDQWVADSVVKVAVLRKASPKSAETFIQVEAIARRFLDHLNNPSIQVEIEKVHKIGESSAKVQEAVRLAAEGLNFQSEKKRLFAGLDVPALRPDYFARVGNTGILLEVERGKTIANNMDLLDLWKCHICEHAEFLFLLVPQRRPSGNGHNTYPFKHVRSRLGAFFVPVNYVNVEAVFLFGY